MGEKKWRIRDGRKGTGPLCDTTQGVTRELKVILSFPSDDSIKFNKIL